MNEETTHPKDVDCVKYKTIRLPVETYAVRFGFQIKDAEAAKEAWRQLVKASDCSIITDPVVREVYDISRHETTTVIEGQVVAYPDIPGPLRLRNPNYLEPNILVGPDV